MVKIHILNNKVKIKDTLLKDNKDTLLKDNKDILLKDNKDTLLKDNKDILLKDTRAIHLKDNKDTLLKDTRAIHLKDNRDIHLKDNTTKIRVMENTKIMDMVTDMDTDTDTDTDMVMVKIITKETIKTIKDILHKVIRVIPLKVIRIMDSILTTCRNKWLQLTQIIFLDNMIKTTQDIWTSMKYRHVFVRFSRKLICKHQNHNTLCLLCRLTTMTKMDYWTFMNLGDYFWDSMD